MAAVAHSPRGYIERPRPSGLADVLEIILDKAGQKGTGRWTLINAAENGVVVSTMCSSMAP